MDEGILPLQVKVARWQNLIPSFPWIVPGWRAWGRHPRKGRDQILQRSVAEPLPEDPRANTYDIKIWLSPSGNLDPVDHLADGKGGHVEPAGPGLVPRRVIYGKSLILGSKMS